MHKWSDWARHYLPADPAERREMSDYLRSKNVWPGDPLEILPAASMRVGGPLADALHKTCRNRLLPIIENPYLLASFRHKCGDPRPWKVQAVREAAGASWEAELNLSWQGEHIGKWLDAAAVLSQIAGDGRLADRVVQAADDLVACQDSDGYLGTYNPQTRLTAPDGAHCRFSWDIWTHRYNIVGLLSAHRHVAGKQAWLDAVKRMMDLLIRVYGAGGKNLTFEGTRRGLSSLTILESVILAYEAIGDRGYLDFAIHLLYETSETNTKVLSRLLDRQSLIHIGDGKAYQLMAVLLGMVRLHRHIGDADLLGAVSFAWEQITQNHLHVTGGPWSRKWDTIRNSECFAPREMWSPFDHVEMCATVTWIQLNLALHQITYLTKYFDAAEVAVWNQLMGGTDFDGWLGTYFSAPNETRRFGHQVHCCNSSAPRGLAVYAEHVVTRRGEEIRVNTYVLGTYDLGGPGGATLTIAGEYPETGNVLLRVQMENERQFPLVLRIPAGTHLASLAVNGSAMQVAPADGSITLDRLWRNGDQVSLDLELETIRHERDYGASRLLAMQKGILILASSTGGMAGDRPLPRMAVDSAAGGALTPYYRTTSADRPGCVTWFAVD